MSLLSTPTGRPERVFSLVSLVRVLGGRVASGDAKEWMAPQFRAGGGGTPMEGDGSGKPGDRVREVFRVARDLGLLDAERDEWVGTCELPATRREFARRVHAHLCGLPAEHPDSVLFRAYAWCAVCIEKHGIAQLVQMSSGDLASEIAAGLGRRSEDNDEKSFNTTKLSAWKDWMAYLGLGWNDLPKVSAFLPDPSRRMEEELSKFLPEDSLVDGQSFLAAVAKNFPYLDGGSFFQEACERGRARPPAGQLSRILSQTVRSLEDSGVLGFQMEGDSKTGIQLFPDPLSSMNVFSHARRLKGDLHV